MPEKCDTFKFIIEGLMLHKSLPCALVFTELLLFFIQLCASWYDLSKKLLNH